MYKKALAAAVVAIALAGCENVQTNNPGMSDDAHLAAFAANSTYPGATTQPSNDLKLGAQIPPNSNNIQLVNYGDEAVAPSDVWVNGAYVQHVQSIPPHGALNLIKSDFYSKGGDRLDQSGATVSQVQIDINGKLYNVLGPVSTNF
jgi:hypothetical protein